jgi:hypothetical protein
MRNHKAKAKVLSFLLFFGVFSGNPSANAATDSGSIAFNGTQYLSSTNMSAPGTGAFTYEFWFYNTVETGTNQTLMNSRGSVSTFQQRDGFDVAINGTRGLFASYRSLAFFNLADGSIARTNENLDFLMADHLVLGYDWLINENLRLKSEVYYQQLSKIGVQSGRPSSLSVVNFGSDFGDVIGPDSLVGSGSGENVGIELT